MEAQCQAIKCMLFLCRFRSCDSSGAIPERSPTPLYYPLPQRPMPTIGACRALSMLTSRRLAGTRRGRLWHKVFRAKDLSEDPPMECAAKQVSSASGMGEAELRSEVELMRKVGDHPSIIGFRHFEQVTEHETPEVRPVWSFLYPSPSPNPTLTQTLHPHPTPSSYTLTLYPNPTP